MLISNEQTFLEEVKPPDVLINPEILDVKQDHYVPSYNVFWHMTANQIAEKKI